MKSMIHHQGKTALIVRTHETQTSRSCEIYDTLKTRLAIRPVEVHSLDEALHWLQLDSYYLIWLDAPFFVVNESKFVNEVRQFHSNWVVWGNSHISLNEEMTALRNGVDLCVRLHKRSELAAARMTALIERIERIAIHPEKTNDPTHNMVDVVVRNGDLQVGRTKKDVRIGTKDIHLSGAEFEMLRVFLRYSGQILCRDFLHERLIGNEWDGLDRSVDQRVVRLRKKLGDSAEHPRWIVSVRGVGYKMNAFHERT